MPMRADVPSFNPGLSIHSNSFIPRSVAASNIQRIVRGNRERKLTKKKERAAKNIQSRFRGNRSRTGKSEKWGLPFPASRRDGNFDPILQKRIINESNTNIRDGIFGIDEEIQNLERRFVDNRIGIDRIDEQLEDPMSYLSLGRNAKQDRVDEYFDQETKRRMEENPDLPEHQDSDNVREMVQDEYDADNYSEYRLDYERSNPELSDDTNKELFNLSQKYTDSIADRNMYESTEKNILEERDLRIDQKKRGERLDIYKCRNIKRMADADERLYFDKDFLENNIKPCRDNLTDIYINTFFDIPWMIINPCPMDISEFGSSTMSIDVVLKIMTKQYSKSVVTALTDTLKTLGLMVKNPIAEDKAYSYDGLPTNNFVILSNFYRWAEPGARTYLEHLPKRIASRISQRINDRNRGSLHPLIVGRMYDRDGESVNVSGRDALEMTLSLFEDTLLERNLKIRGKPVDKQYVERIKRFFILRLIGFIGNPEYIDYLNKLIRQLENEIMSKRRISTRPRAQPPGAGQMPQHMWLMQKEDLVDHLKFIKLYFIKYPFNLK